MIKAFKVAFVIAAALYVMGTIIALSPFWIFGTNDLNYVGRTFLAVIPSVVWTVIWLDAQP